MIRIIAYSLFLVCLPVVNLSADNSAQEINNVLQDLEIKMSGVKTIQASFIQEKNLALFNQKIILKGKIFIQKPGLLSWRVITPLRYSMVINGNTISQWDEDTNQVQQVSLAKNPSFQVAIQQMQNWFCGAYKSMQGDYKITLTTALPITLQFIPLENAVSGNFIKRVVVLFQNDGLYIKEINIEEENGDTTLLKFIGAKVDQPINLKAWEVKADVR